MDILKIVFYLKSARYNSNSHELNAKNEVGQIPQETFLLNWPNSHFPLTNKYWNEMKYEMKWNMK